ncbi:putative membrane protein [Treponema primitia ZAS-2]|uniref:Putative membrane protein n=1 Tax=Treponema primitia (strain ATCC BAA-887 / DSM 12427 / ZAS-2) TaxID=545694 RepID=F5YR90_TREPZ|nr:hypothetical protein [Treponema primitia]AEF86396.1 putative membrane protein [Treponema primitia ZAS-2]
MLILLFFVPGMILPAEERVQNIPALETSRRVMLAGILRERKIPFEERSLFAGYGGFGFSIHVSLPASTNEGGEKKPGTFILAVPLSGAENTGDTKNPEDFPFGFDLALGFIEKVLAEGTETDILVAFLGDEWTALPHPAEDPHRGLEDLYSRIAVPESTGLVYLDMNLPSGEIVIHHGAQKALAPLHILKPLGSLCESRGIPYTLAIRFNELYKLGLAEGPSPLEFAYARSIPAIYISGNNAVPANPAGSTLDAPALGELILDYVRALDLGAENHDYHYLVFQYFGKTLFVPEYATVLFFLAIAALFVFAVLIYSVVFRFRLAVQWKIFLKQSWILLLFYLLLVLSLSGASLLFRLLIQDTGTLTGLRGNAPALFYAAAGIQLLGIALFTLISPALNLIYVPRRANFYGSSAVILSALEILLAAFLDITFIPIFIWVFFFTFLASCFTQPLLIWLCAIFSFLRGAEALRALYLTGNTQFETLILSGNIPVILYVALISLPFFIILKRGRVIQGREKNQPWLFKGVPGFTVLVCAAASLGTGIFFLNRIPASLPIPPREAPGSLDMKVTSRVWLERRTLGITLEAPGHPLKFELYLDGSAETPGQEIPIIYSAPMPFRYIEDENLNSMEFVLGEGPPNPFTTEIVLPVNFNGYLRAEAVYLEGKDGDYQPRLSRRLPVGGISP